MILTIKTNQSFYDVIIQKNILNDINNYLDLNRKVLIITDSGIPLTYINTVKNQCNNCFVYTIKHGEESKSIDNYQKIISYMIENNFTRNDAIIALGGGVVGDLSGFISSTYMRGITFYNIPTTLLSQIDSSIGGKTAIDFNGVKNIVGSFYQPSKVIIDPETLNTLSKRQLHSGLVEAIKMSLTSDSSLFDLILNTNNLLDDIETIIYKSLLIKKEIVEKDEKENNLRRVLNFGHTIGHAVESLNLPSLLHGEAVGIGMMYFCSDTVKHQLKTILEKYNLPTSATFNKDEAFSLISHDKKALSDEINVIIVEKIGEFKQEKIKLEQFKNIL